MMDHDDQILTILTTLFNAFIIHGYLPDAFMKSAIVPIIKIKQVIQVILITIVRLL